MMAVQEKTQADFDLEQLFGLLDEAMTSQDERVQSALRSLLTIVTLTRTQDDNKMAVETSHGPLRQIQQDVRNLSRRVSELEREVSGRKQYIPPGATPPNWWGPDPTDPYSTSKGTSTVTLGKSDINITIDTTKLTK